MLWSVIIPARNEEKTLSDCVDSVKKQQGFFDTEIIVVDNNSADKTKEVAENCGATVINEPRYSVGQARKTGAEAAKGEWIVNLDADSRLPTDYFLRAAKIFEQEQGLVCLGGQVFFYDAPLWLNVLRFLFHRPLYYYARAVSGSRVGPLGNNMIFRKSDYQKTAGFDADSKFGEDSDVCRKLSALGKVKIDFGLKCLISSRRYQWNQNPIAQFRAFLAVCRGLPVDKVKFF